MWRLDRLALSLPELIGVVTTLEERGVGRRSLHKQLDTTSPGGRHPLHEVVAAHIDFLDAPTKKDDAEAPPSA